MRNLILFLWKQRFFLLFLLLEVFAVFLIVSNNSYQRSHFAEATSEISGKMYSLSDDIVSYFHLRETNKQLAQENADLHNQLASSYISLDTNTHLVKDTLRELHYKYYVSKVLSNSFQKRNNYLIISKGRKQGIERDMGVIGPLGVVGIVNHVSENFSSVISILHGQTALGAKLKKTGYSGSLTWNGKDYRVGQLINIPSHVQLELGDTVVTSGYSHIFPEGQLLGTIEDFEEIKGKGFYRINVRFATQFNKLEYVHIVQNLLREEIQSLRKENTNE